MDDYPDWLCCNCGNEWYDEEIVNKDADECPTCGSRFMLVWIGLD